QPFLLLGGGYMSDTLPAEFGFARLTYWIGHETKNIVLASGYLSEHRSIIASLPRARCRPSCLFNQVSKVGRFWTDHVEKDLMLAPVKPPQDAPLRILRGYTGRKGGKYRRMHRLRGGLKEAGSSACRVQRHSGEIHSELLNQAHEALFVDRAGCGGIDGFGAVRVLYDDAGFSRDRTPAVLSSLGVEAQRNVANGLRQFVACNRIPYELESDFFALGTALVGFGCPPFLRAHHLVEFTVTQAQ